MKKILFLSLISTFILSNSIHALSPSSTCPTVDAIKKMGLNSVIIVDKTWQAAWLPNDSYGTEQHWQFLLGGGQMDVTQDKEEGLRKAEQALTSLTFISGPIQDKQQTLCYYRTNEKARGIAISPPTYMNAAR